VREGVKREESRLLDKLSIIEIELKETTTKYNGLLSICHMHSQVVAEVFSKV
jgi:hypothetical protein